MKKGKQVISNKLTKIIVLLFVLIVFSTLSSFNNGTKRKIVIALVIESQFNNNNVKIFFDNKIVYKKNGVTTNEISGVAGYIKVITKDGTHKIVFKVDILTSNPFVFSTDSCKADTLYFGLQNKKNNLNIKYYKKTPKYD